MLLRPLSADPLARLDNAEDVIAMSTERQVAESLAIAEAAKTTLGVPATAQALLQQLTVTAAVDANVLTFAFESTDAEKAARGADAFRGRTSTSASRGRRTRSPRSAPTTSSGWRRSSPSRPRSKRRSRPSSPTPRRTRPRSGTRTPVEPSSRPSRRWSPTASTMSPASASRAARSSHRRSYRPLPQGIGNSVLVLAGFVMGGLAGLVIAFIRNSLDPHVTSVDSASQLLGAPVVGLIEDRHPRRKRTRLKGDATAAALRRTAATIDARLGEHSRTPIVVLAISRATPASDVAGGLADGLARRSTVAVVDAVSASRTATPLGGPDTTDEPATPESANGRTATTATTASIADNVTRLLEGNDLVVVAPPPLDANPLAVDMLSIPGTIVLPVVRIGHTRRDELMNVRRDLTNAGADVAGGDRHRAAILMGSGGHGARWATAPGAQDVGRSTTPAGECLMRVLVTGCAGFIGSTLAERLRADGHQVIGVDCFTPYYDVETKRRNACQLLERGVDVCEADLRTVDVDALLRGVEVVLHQAGQPGVRASWEQFDAYVEHNILATRRLLDAATRAGIHRFVYASSSSVYGDAETFPTGEEACPSPRSPYGMTKLAAEHLCGVYARSFGVPTVSLRYFTVFGPRQRPDMAMHRLIEAALDGTPFPMYGDGSQTRDFTFVDDIVEANILAATLDGVPPGAVMNVAGGCSSTLGSVIATVEGLVGRPIALDDRGEQPGDVVRTGGSTDAARRLLGWAPSVGLDDGLARQVDWHRARRT